MAEAKKFKLNSPLFYVYVKFLSFHAKNGYKIQNMLLYKYSLSYCEYFFEINICDYVVWK